MTGWLVVNAFTHSPKFMELYNMFHVAARNQCVELVQVNTIEVSRLVSGGAVANDWPDFVLFWDKDTQLCRALEKMGCRCLNRAAAIAACDNKAQTYVELLDLDIRQPKTLLTPKAYRSERWEETPYPSIVVRELGLPVVVKECYGSFGAQVHLAHSEHELSELLEGFGARPSLCQEYVASSKGRDVRLQVVGGAVVASMERVSRTGDFRANLTNGGVARDWSPTSAQVCMALDACSGLGLDFAGVDILFGPDDEPILCEVNSNAHFVNIYNVTGVDVASCILDHAVREASRER